MKIHSVHIRNFRKLKNCHIDFGEKETVFIGANNSGKTSAISAIAWFLKNKEKFTLKEFTATNWALIDTLGDQWLAKDLVDEELLNPHNGIILFRQWIFGLMLLMENNTESIT